MEKTNKNANNNVHLLGFINDVRINPVKDGLMAINLDVVTSEMYRKDRSNPESELQTKRSYHDVAIFTEDAKFIEKFQKIAADLGENRQNRDVEGYKPKTHSVSLDGILVNKENTVKGTDATYRTLQILADAKNVSPDVKFEKGEVRNSAMLVGNIADIRMVEDRKLAVVTLIHHYRPKDSEKEFVTTVDVRVNGARKVGAEAYAAIQNGEIGKGDFIRTGGQLHNTRYDVQPGEGRENVTEGTRYGVSLDATSFKVLSQKKDESQAEKAAEAPEVKEEKKEEKKAATKKATSRKAAEGAKKAPAKKAGIKM